jgi:hypothetical protein
LLAVVTAAAPRQGLATRDRWVANALPSEWRALIIKSQNYSMIPKSGCRFSEKIMLRQ